MKDGQPTYKQMCEIIGAIYADAYLRIEFLENENKQLRAKQSWNNGNGNSMLPESLMEKFVSESGTQSSTLSPQPENRNLSPQKSTEMSEEKLNLKEY